MVLYGDINDDIYIHMYIYIYYFYLVPRTNDLLFFVWLGMGTTLSSSFFFWMRR